MFAPPSNPSPQLQTVLRWFQAIVQWDFNALETLLSDDYLHVTLPASAGDPDKNKDEGIAHAKSIAALLGGQDMNFELYDTNESEGKIWTHTRLYTKLANGTIYDNESIFLFTLSAGKEPQITVIKEFIDTKAMEDLAKAFSGDN